MFCTLIYTNIEGYILTYTPQTAVGKAQQPATNRWATFSANFIVTLKGDLSFGLGNGMQLLMG